MSDLIDYEASVPKMVAPEGEAADYWLLSVEADGFVPVGEQEVTSDDENEAWRIRGAVRRPNPPKPTEAAVVAGAQELCRRIAPHKPWDDLPAGVKNHWAQVTLDVLTAACPHLEVDR